MIMEMPEELKHISKNCYTEDKKIVYIKGFSKKDYM